VSRTEDQRRLLELFDRLLDVPSEEQAAWIVEQAGDSAELRAGLEALLAAHAARTGPLDRPPRPTNARTLDADTLRSRLDAAIGDRYEIEEELGRGGMAIVFRARERKHDRPVVLKVLRPELVPFLGEDRFEREVRIASQMSHPNIIGLIDSGTADGLPFFVMPFVPGATLRTRLESEGRLSAETVRTLLHDIAAGLAHAHDLGVVHRDLKPENILCVGDHAYIMDFGIARPFADIHDEGLTRPGLALGTPRYMSPEQRAGRAVDARTDLYAWGLIARELWAEESPPPWADVVEACLRDDPEQRPADAAALQRAVAPISERWVPWKRLAGRAWPWAAAALALAILAFGTVWRAREPATTSTDPVARAGTLSTPLAVAPFRNETDDPSLDMLGRFTADWIVQGLQQADVGPVVPWSATLSAAEDVARSGGQADSLPGLLARDLSAGTLISGAIYAIGDRLSFAAVVTDVRTRRVISAPEPITVAADSSEQAVREIRDRILGSLAIQQDPLFATIPGLSGRPPLLEAYRAFERGHELFQAQEYGEAQTEYERAFALDTTFLVARLSLALAQWNRGLWADVDSSLAWLELRRDRLSEYHDLRRRSLSAQRTGDGERAYRLELRRSELGPTPLGSYNAAALANDLNRPDEALRLLLGLDPNSPGLRGWAQYWTQLAHAYHGLGKFDEEFEAASEMWARFPERRIGPVLAARALAASGRRGELDSLFASVRLLPSDTYWSYAAARVVAGEEARAHRGDTDDAMADLREGISWLEARLREDPANRSHRYWLAAAHYDLENYTTAARLYERLWNDHPERTDYRAGMLVARARLDGAGAARGVLDDEPMQGHEFATLARIEAAGGDAERALSLLGEGLRRGISGRNWLHATSLPDLGRLAADPRYAAALGQVVPTAPLSSPPVEVP
jgi:tRNA A-37 threonylcarbamoyl transferase component Bud32/tetratricopeptide (TPR) repeat protein